MEGNSKPFFCFSILVACKLRITVFCYSHFKFASLKYKSYNMSTCENSLMEKILSVLKSHSMSILWRKSTRNTVSFQFTEHSSSEKLIDSHSKTIVLKIIKPVQTWMSNVFEHFSWSYLPLGLTQLQHSVQSG